MDLSEEVFEKCAPTNYFLFAFYSVCLLWTIHGILH